MSFLDVGTGTGILAIAAAKLGMNPVIATEIDESALQDAADHSRSNGVAVDLRLGAQVPEGKFDLVCCNILLPELLRLLPDLRARMNEAANQRRAYDELPQPTKDRIDGIIARHHYGNRDDLDETSRTVASVLTPEQKKKVSWVHHRLARPHPHTGRRALYAVSGSSFGIEGMNEADGIRLLDEMKVHATQPRYQQRYDYAPGDVIIWDNAQLLHAAPLPDAREERTLWRITVKERA